MGVNFYCVDKLRVWFLYNLYFVCFGSVTKNYFENLVRALENGLSDVDGNGATSSKAATSSKNTAGSSKGRGGRGKGSTRSSNANRTMDD